MDPAAGLIHLALLIPSWLSHREDANRLFGTDPLKKMRCDVGWSQPGTLHGQRTNKLLTVLTRHLLRVCLSDANAFE